MVLLGCQGMSNSAGYQQAIELQLIIGSALYFNVPLYPNFLLLRQVSGLENANPKHDVTSPSAAADSSKASTAKNSTDLHSRYDV